MENSDVPPSAPSLFPTADRWRVDVEFDPSNPTLNDLIAYLTSEHLLVEPRRRSFIATASDVVSVTIRRRDAQTQSSPNREPFKYPAYFHLDRFMSEYKEYTLSKITAQTAINVQVAALEGEKHNLSTFEVSLSASNRSIRTPIYSSREKTS